MSYKKINLHIIWFLKKSALSMAAVKCLCIYILHGISFSCGVLVFLWPKQGCLWLYYTVPFGVAGNAIPLRPSTKGLGLRYGSAAARSVAKIPYKTQRLPLGFWNSCPCSAAEISVPSLKSKHICPWNRKIPNGVTSSMQASLCSFIQPLRKGGDWVPPRCLFRDGGKPSGGPLR